MKALVLLLALATLAVPSTAAHVPAAAGTGGAGPSAAVACSLLPPALQGPCADVTATACAYAPPSVCAVL